MTETDEKIINKTDRAIALHRVDHLMSQAIDELDRIEEPADGDLLLQLEQLRADYTGRDKCVAILVDAMAMSSPNAAEGLQERLARALLSHERSKDSS